MARIKKYRKDGKLTAAYKKQKARAAAKKRPRHKSGKKKGQFK